MTIWSDSHIKANLSGTERPERSGSSVEQAGSGGAGSVSASPGEIPFSLPLAPGYGLTHEIVDSRGWLVIKVYTDGLEAYEEARSYVISAVNQHEELKRQSDARRQLIVDMAKFIHGSCQHNQHFYRCEHPFCGAVNGSLPEPVSTEEYRLMRERLAAAERQRDELLKALEEICAICVNPKVPTDFEQEWWLRINQSRKVAEIAVAKIKRGEL